MNEKVIVVFGGTGFLGRRIVRALVAAGHRVRVAARRPSAVTFPDAGEQVLPVAVDIGDETLVIEAVAGAAAVVNAVSLYVEKGGLTFEAIHVQGAERIARCAKAAGVERLVHISGIGVNVDSPSSYVQARARGERVVRAAFEQATLVRPSVMFGGDDAFLASLEAVTRFPVVPLFGRGENRLQPVYVMDVAVAVAQLAGQAGDQGQIFELGGGQIYSYRQAVQAVMVHLGRKRLLLPVPFPLWQALVAVLGVLPNPPLTSDQLTLMKSDNIVGPGTKTFADLGINPSSLEDLLEDCLP